MISGVIRLTFLTLLVSSITNCADTNTTTVSSTTTTTKTSSITTTTSISTTSTEKSKTASSCTLNESSPYEKSLLKEVMQLDKKQFSWDDGDHKYYFGVCSKSENSNNNDEAFIQINKKSNNYVVIGRLNDVDIEGFGVESKGIRLQYRNGDRYPNECNRAERHSVVYIICNPNNSSDIFEMIEENHSRKGDSCNYIFQLRTPLMCSNMTKPCPMNRNATTPANPSKQKSKLGLTTIMLMIVFFVLFIYFVVGTVYNRYVKEARGIEQLPHHEAWQALGVKSADICNYICRCGKTQSEIRNYEHINDHLSDDDENLLNM